MCNIYFSNGFNNQVQYRCALTHHFKNLCLNQATFFKSNIEESCYFLKVTTNCCFCTCNNLHKIANIKLTPVSHNAQQKLKTFHNSAAPTCSTERKKHQICHANIDNNQILPDKYSYKLQIYKKSIMQLGFEPTTFTSSDIKYYTTHHFY